MPPALRLRALHKTFRAGVAGCAAHAHALRGVDLDVEEGELVALSGPAGAGKSTLLLCAAGLLVPDAGAALLPGAGPLPAARARAVYLSAGGWGTAARVREPPSRAPSSQGGGSRQARAPVPPAAPTRLLLVDALDEVAPVDVPGVVRRLSAVAAGGVAVVAASREDAPALAALHDAGARTVRLVAGRVAEAWRARPGAAALELRLSSPAAAVRLRASGLPLCGDGATVRVPLDGTSAEAVLARCLALRVGVAASRVVREPCPARGGGRDACDRVPPGACAHACAHGCGRVDSPSPRS